MEIYKFGGASIQNAKSIRRVVDIFHKAAPGKLLIVVSAMGKTTNHLERLHSQAVKFRIDSVDLNYLSEYHLDIAGQLFGDNDQNALSSVRNLLNGLKMELNTVYKTPHLSPAYSKIVCFGELLSSTIMSRYFHLCGVPIRWIDARNYIRTDSNYLEGVVDWDYTRDKIRRSLPRILNTRPVITQGFIARDKKGHTTTLGREGSDFTAAIFGSCLKATRVSVWKDVDGIRTADPQYHAPTSKYARLSYQETAEMTYYGAKVIHPKTIKPLALAGIPLHVRSFLDIRKSGTVIDQMAHAKLSPSIIFKFNQCLISFRVKDFTFINEKNLSIIFHRLDLLGIKINLMQNSAISLSICVDHTPAKIKDLIDSLSGDFGILYNEKLHLITVKNYDQQTIKTVSHNKKILLEQRSRVNYQIVIPDEHIRLPIEAG